MMNILLVYNSHELSNRPISLQTLAPKKLYVPVSPYAIQVFQRFVLESRSKCKIKQTLASKDVEHLVVHAENKVIFYNMV